VVPVVLTKTERLSQPVGRSDSTLVALFIKHRAVHLIMVLHVQIACFTKLFDYLVTLTARSAEYCNFFN